MNSGSVSERHRPRFFLRGPERPQATSESCPGRRENLCITGHRFDIREVADRVSGPVGRTARRCRLVNQRCDAVLTLDEGRQKEEWVCTSDRLTGAPPDPGTGRSRGVRVMGAISVSVFSKEIVNAMRGNPGVRFGICSGMKSEPIEGGVSCTRSCLLW